MHHSKHDNDVLARRCVWCDEFEKMEVKISLTLEVSWKVVEAKCTLLCLVLKKESEGKSALVPIFSLFSDDVF